MRSIVEHPFLTLKRWWGFAKVRYRGLAKNANRAYAMLALINLSKWGTPLTDRCVRREQNTKEIPGLSTKTGLETQENDTRFANPKNWWMKLDYRNHLISVSLSQTATLAP